MPLPLLLLSFFGGAPYKVPGYPVVVFGAHFSSLCGTRSPSSTTFSPFVPLLVLFNVSFICSLVPRHENGLEEWMLMEPGQLGIALYLGPLFSLFDACLLISGCRLHCVSSGGHCLALWVLCRLRRLPYFVASITKMV